MKTVLLLLVMLAANLPAQRTTANLYGTIRDASAGTVPAATVRLVNDATSATVEVKSNERGEFTLSFLPPGLYTLEISVTGFKAFRRTAIRLESGQQLSLIHI